jgi:hypothetical protein
MTAGQSPPTADDELQSHPQLWMFPYVQACRTAGVLELHSGDVLGLRWDRSLTRPRLVARGAGVRCIVVRVQRAWHGYASKVVVAMIGGDSAPA